MRGPVSFPNTFLDSHVPTQLPTNPPCCLPLGRRPACRCRAAAVSKRWSRCSTSPQLLQCLDVRFAAAGSPQAAELPTLRSWAAFMLRHGRHVRRLTLRVYRADSAEAQLLLNTGLTACAAAEAQVLEDLSLAFWCSGGALLASEWAAALTGLQRLKLIAADELRVTANLAGLCQLHTLRLLSARVILEPQVQLPTSLQAVRLGDSCSGELPRQASGCDAGDWDVGPSQQPAGCAGPSRQPAPRVPAVLQLWQHSVQMFVTGAARSCLLVQLAWMPGTTVIVCF